MNNNFSYTEAVIAVLNETGLNVNEARGFNIEQDNGLFSISFRTDWLRYTAYVDCASCEVLGLDFEPCIYMDAEAEQDDTLFGLSIQDNSAA